MSCVCVALVARLEEQAFVNYLHYLQYIRCYDYVDISKMLVGTELAQLKVGLDGLDDLLRRAGGGRRLPVTADDTAPSDHDK